MNYFCTFDIARAVNYSGFCTGVTVVVRSTAGLTEPSTGTGFGGDTRFDMGVLELLLW